MKEWIDNHREFILIVFVLPIGKIMSLIAKIKYKFNSPKISEHDNRVKRIQEEILANADSNKPMRMNRMGHETLETRSSDKSKSTIIQVKDLRKILSVDKAKNIIRLEPYVTIGEVVDNLDKMGLELETAIEMKGATMGGLVLAIGMTTHSHQAGLMSDIVESYDIVTAEGKLIKVTKDGEHAALFRAIPMSHGTLGVIVAMELRIKKAPKFVELVYRPFYNFDEFIAEHTRLLTKKDAPYYLEAQVFGKDKAVIIEGYPSTKKDLPINNINNYYKPFFFKHVEAQLKLGKGKEYRELVPNAQFLMRHERSMCMTLGKILPTANEPWFRIPFGWLLPPFLPLLKMSRPLEERERSMKHQVYQDIGFPHEKLKEVLLHLDDEFEIYPLLLYPCRVFDQGGLIRTPGNKGKKYEDKTESKLYFNLGIYGEPKAIRNGDKNYPTIAKVREVEHMIIQMGGFLHTYVDVFTTEEEFEEMFDHSLWYKMREKYNVNNMFPSIYEKVKPEIDPLQLMKEQGK